LNAAERSSTEGDGAAAVDGAGGEEEEGATNLLALPVARGDLAENEAAKSCTDVALDVDVRSAERRDTVDKRSAERRDTAERRGSVAASNGFAEGAAP